MPQDTKPKPKANNQPPGEDKNRTLKIVLIVVGALILLGILGSLLLGFGLLKFGERLAEEAANGDVNVTDDGISIKTDEGEFESSTQLPDNFPAEVPLYANAELTSSTSTRDNASGDETFIVSYTTGDSSAMVTDFYKSALNANGWSITRESTFNDVTVLNAQREDLELSATINPEGGEDGQTGFTLNVSRDSQ